MTVEAGIGTLNEGSLHAALKERYAEPGDEFEVPLDGFVIDIRRPGQLIEIQTSSFKAMGRKLDRLLGESLSDYVRVYANCPVLLTRIEA